MPIQPFALSCIVYQFLRAATEPRTVTFPRDHFANDQRRQNLTQHPDRLSGNPTREATNAFSQRRDYDLPSDIPPEKVHAVIRADIEDRLRHVCGNWSTGEFDRVVADVTATAMKFHTPAENPQVPETFYGATTAPNTTGETAGLLRSAMASVHQVLRLDRGHSRTR